MINQFFTLIQNATISLPAAEIAALLSCLSVCLVFKMTRVGLLTAYLFTYRWGWLIFTDKSQTFLLSYLIFGTVVGILTVIGMLQAPSDD